MTHCTMDELLAIRANEGSVWARQHLEACPLCHAEMEALYQRVAQLKALPSLSPARDRWPVIRARVAAAQAVRRRQWVASGLAAAAVLAGVTMLAAAGCAPTAAPESASTTTAHDLTIAEAQAAYHDYLTVSDAAAAQGNQAQGQSDVAFEQWALVHTQYTALEAQGTPVPRYQYGPPVFYVPAEAGYPQWFMVAVPRTTLVSGHPGATVNTLMVFERPKAGASWTLDGAAELDQPLPAITLDKDGYAIALRTTASDLLLRPDVVGPTQAAVVDEGPTAPAAAVIGSGPQTTGLFTTQDAQGNSAAAHGLAYQ
jgi:hypothetical protein